MDKLVKKQVGAALATKKKGEAFFKSFAKEVALAIDNQTVGYIYGALRSWAEGFDKVAALAKEALKRQVMEVGTPTGEKGSKELVLEGGVRIPLIARRSEWDDKKVEALLRAKGLDPEEHMKVEKRFRTDPMVLINLAGEGRPLTLEEVNACHGETTYALMPPRKTKAEDET